MNCPKCGKSELYAKTESVDLSVGGLFSALIVIVGLFVLAFNGVAGLLTIILGTIIGITGRPKKTVLVCPACQYTTDL